MEQKQKSMISMQSFLIFIYLNFRKFRSRFWYQLKQERETKKHYLGTIFLIFKFSNFSKFENRFWCQPQHTFLIDFKFFRSYATISFKFWYTIKQIYRYNAIIPGIIFLAWIYSCIKFCRLKWENSQL